MCDHYGVHCTFVYLCACTLVCNSIHVPVRMLSTAISTCLSCVQYTYIIYCGIYTLSDFLILVCDFLLYIDFMC